MDRKRAHPLVLYAVGIVFLISCNTTHVGTPSITQRRVDAGTIHGLVIGPKGTLWYTHDCNAVTRLDTDGASTTFYVPTIRTHDFVRPSENLFPTGCTSSALGIGAIAIGKDDALWFTENTEAAIGRMTRSGSVRFFPIPHGWTAQRIVSGPDGDLWFTQMYGNAIGRISMTGNITEYRLHHKNSHPYDIVEGPDGALWFTEHGDGKIGRLTTAGALTEYATPTADSTPLSIAVGSDRALWFTEVAAQKIGRITTSGTITEYSLPWLGPGPDFIAAGSRGTLWFTEEVAGKIGRISTDGSVAEYDVPPIPAVSLGRDSDGDVKVSTPTFLRPYLMADGHRGTIWFTEPGSDLIGKLKI